MTREPFIAHSELTNEIYIVVGKEKYRVTEQAIKAVMAIKALEQQPETAHWIKVPDEETFFCSKCNARLYDEQIYLPFNYCPNCGAKMIEPQESEDKE